MINKYFSSVILMLLVSFTLFFCKKKEAEIRSCDTIKMERDSLDVDAPLSKYISLTEEYLNLCATEAEKNELETDTDIANALLEGKPNATYGDIKDIKDRTDITDIIDLIDLTDLIDLIDLTDLTDLTDLIKPFLISNPDTTPRK